LINEELVKQRFLSEQRAAILAGAIGVFAEKGLKGATIRAVGRAAGVNSALIYYYFDDKEALFVEAIKEVMRGLVGHLEAEKRPFAGGRDRLSYLVNGIWDYYSAHPERMRLVSVAVSLHAELFGQVINGFVKDRVLVPLDVLKEGMVRHELREVSPVLAWWSILGICIFSLHIKGVLGHVDFLSLPFPLPDMEQSRQPIIDLLVEGLAKRGKEESKKANAGRRGLFSVAD
jgi:TetR/AcrR family transcriptional regulator